MDILNSKIISCVDFWGNVTATVQLAKGLKFAHCVTGWPIVIEELLETSCIVRLKSGNIMEISHSQLEKWKYVEEIVTVESVTSSAVTVESVTSSAVTVESVTVDGCAVCGKPKSPRAKTCSAKCRKKLSRMS